MGVALFRRRLDFRRRSGVQSCINDEKADGLPLGMHFADWGLMTRLTTSSLAFRSALVALVAAGAAGCNETVDSDAIRTRGMYAGMTAVTDAEGGTVVQVKLRVGGDDGTNVNLTGGDELTAQIDEGKAKTLTGDDGDYSTKFSGLKGGEKLLVSFSRGEDDDDAPDSNVKIAEPFSFAVDSASDAFPRGLKLPLTWDKPKAGNTTMRWSVKGDCIWSEHGEFGSDDGSGSIAASDIDAKSADEDCDVTVTLERVVRGSLDSAFEEGGQIESIQRRKLTFFSVAEGTAVPGDDEPDQPVGGDSGAPSQGDGGSDGGMMESDGGVMDGGMADVVDGGAPNVDAAAAVDGGN